MGVTWVLEKNRLQPRVTFEINAGYEERKRKRLAAERLARQRELERTRAVVQAICQGARVLAHVSGKVRDEVCRRLEHRAEHPAEHRRL
jgi:hypothetical protein